MTRGKAVGCLFVVLAIPGGLVGYHLSQGVRLEDITERIRAQAEGLARGARDRIEGRSGGQSASEQPEEVSAQKTTEDRAQTAMRIFEAGIRYRDKGHPRSAEQAFKYVADKYGDLPVAENAHAELAAIRSAGVGGG
ncbi:MAG: hypothetical protein L0216_21390 [Planctomycetales bacterium]|nr:hypothetical protein [Planctomycetales bacterium]